LSPPLFFQVPSAFAPLFSPIGFLWCSHASYFNILYLLPPRSVSGQAPGPQAGESTDAIVRLISASNPAIGCLVVATATDKTDTTPAPILPTARYIVRFGLLLAANPVAYLLRPGVPRADAYELSLVQQLATLPGQAFTDAVGIY